MNLPAIVITGDTDQEIAEKIQLNNCTLLHKPVMPENLRTTIFNLKHLETIYSE
jgi:DNA-binding NtrC family response regulator